MESAEEMVRFSDERTYHKFNFKKAIIQINYFEDFFTFVDFDLEERWKIPLSAFKFSRDNIKKLNNQYSNKGLKDSSSGSSTQNEVFDKSTFQPIDEFIDQDQIIHIAPHFVYLFRGYLTTKSAPSNKKLLHGRDSAKIYKFDFVKFEYHQVFSFHYDVYKAKISRFSMNENQPLELKQASTKNTVLVAGYKGFLIIGGKGVELEEKVDEKFIKKYYFFATHNEKDEILDILYQVTQKASVIGAEFHSQTMTINKRDYVLLNGGYKKKSEKSKLDRDYNSIFSFKILFYLEDLNGLSSQTLEKGMNDDPSYLPSPNIIAEDKYWNHSNYIIVPNGGNIYLLGGKSMIEAADLYSQNFNIIKFKILCQGAILESILPEEDFKSKRLKRTVLFNNENYSDLCYLSYLNDEEVMEKIYGLWTTYDDPHELEIFEYDCKKYKPKLKNLRINYCPVKYINKIQKYVI